MHGDLLRVIARFEPFHGLDRSMLQALARHARLVEVPAGRWLARRGWSFHDSHFLVSGALQTIGPARIIRADQPSALRPVQPGAGGLRTVSACVLLRLADEGMRLLEVRERPGQVTVVERDDCWQIRFLESHLMTALPRGLWQKVLSRLEGLEVAAGDRVIVEGTVDQPGACYIMGSAGRAEVTAGGRRVGLVGAGDLFGEDALISSRPRNATVRMVEAGAVMRLAAGHFGEFLADVFACGTFRQPEGSAESGAPREYFRVGDVETLRERIASLDPRVVYLVSDGSEAAAVLALFLMRKQGLSVFAAA